jgi:hypothetical protein
MYLIEATGDMWEIEKRHDSTSYAIFEIVKDRVDVQRGLGALIRQCRRASVSDWQAIHDEALAFLKSMQP